MTETAETGARGARVEARGWGWRHAGRRDPAVSGLDLVIEPGERVLLLGASGAGKSTLLHGLAGILGGAEEGEQTGELLVDGSPAATVRGAAGLVLQDPDTQAVLARLGDDVAFGLENLGVAPDEIRRRVPEALAAVGLGGLPLDHSTTALSGGQKQRLALAGVLAMRPSLLLLDEPTANLDPEGVREVVDAVVTAAGARTLVVVEHRVEAWWPHITRVVVLGPEGIVADGAPDAVVAAARAPLEQAGVWLPGAADAVATRPAGAPGPVLLRGTGLAVGRVGRSRRDLRRGRPANAEQLAAAARDVDVEVRAGRVLALTGPNGAGKTTLALTLAGLIPPVAGEVEASAELAAGAAPDPADWRSRELLTRIGVVFQSPDHQFLATTVRNELELGPLALGAGRAETTELVDELLERLRLSRLARAHPFSLSGGEKRRLSVATVLATSPRVLVLDEPTFGQDARTWRELVALLAEQRDAGRAVVVVTHDRPLVRALDADELALEAPRFVPNGRFEGREATISHESPGGADGVVAP